MNGHKSKTTAEWIGLLVVATVALAGTAAVVLGLIALYRWAL